MRNLENLREEILNYFEKIYNSPGMPTVWIHLLQIVVDVFEIDKDIREKILDIPYTINRLIQDGYLVAGTGNLSGLFCYKKEYDRMRKKETKQYTIEVQRISYANKIIPVEAFSREEAENLALDKAGDEIFEEYHADYEIM